MLSRPGDVPASDEEANAWQETIRSDPALFFREVLGIVPWDRQVKIAESVRDNDRTSVRSCHGAGKTFTASGLVLWFLAAYPYSTVITTAPTGRQVRKVLWQEIRRMHATAPVAIGGRSLDVEIKIDDKWGAFGFSAKDSAAFQGIHGDYILVILDEAAGVDQQIWIGADGVLSGGMARLLTIGNPTEGMGAFYEEHRTLPAKAKIKISAFDTPNFTALGIKRADIKSGAWRKKVAGKTMPYPGLVQPAWVADKYRRWKPSSPLYQSRVEGEFPSASPYQLIPLSWIEAAQRRTLCDPEWLGEEPDEDWNYKGGVLSGEVAPDKPPDLGLDIARFGDDHSSWYASYDVPGGKVVRCVGRLFKQRTTEIENATVKKIKMLWPASVRIEGGGSMGVGPIDHLRQIEYAEGHDVSIIEILPGKPASDSKHYANWRAQAWWNVREMFDPDNGTIDIDPDDDELAAQLSSLLYKPDRLGRTLIWSKEDMKSKGLPSPDDADSVMLATSRPGEIIFDDETAEVGAPLIGAQMDW